LPSFSTGVLEAGLATQNIDNHQISCFLFEQSKTCSFDHKRAYFPNTNVNMGMEKNPSMTRGLPEDL
jgi:hypothetical protein